MRTFLRRRKRADGERKRRNDSLNYFTFEHVFGLKLERQIYEKTSRHHAVMLSMFDKLNLEVLEDVKTLPVPYGVIFVRSNVNVYV